MIITLNNNNFTQEVLSADLPVVVDFWAPWCGPCRMMAPILERVADHFAGRLKVAKLNTEEADNQALVNHYDIQGIPNLKIFFQGEVQADLVGLRPEAVLIQELEDFLNQSSDHEH